MLIDDIHTYLVSQGLTNLYIGEIPQEIENAVSMINVASPPPNPAIGYYEQLIDFWSRFRKTDDGYNILKDFVLDDFHQKVNWETTDYHIYLSVAVGLIDDVDRDAENRKLQRVTIRFIYRNKND